MGILQDLLTWAEKLAVRWHKKPPGYDPAKLQTLDEIQASLPCGSLLLCSGTAPESRLIEEVDGTDFSHVAMIVRFHGDSQLYLWTADTVDQLPDQIHKDKNLDHPGTHLLKLETYLADLDRFYPSPDGSKYRFAVSRLQGVTPDEARLWAVMFAYDDTPFPSTQEEFWHWLEGQEDVPSGMQNSFCAQMVANTYQKMGWMLTDHPPNHYNPGDFAQTARINRQLTGGASLLDPEYFVLEH
ncbi:hypothetical protein [Marinospirillum perlucidum]|uniref:hypothetical protein n=1 Tax=Marinospirillum perlucidum TaxID=1982602 RepID=UPI000DF1FCA2|nr:hypothetical protein [Marinospirillum perlucidum]